VLGIAPFDVKNNASSITTLAVAIGIDVALSAVSILKGKPLLGLIGIFIPFVSLTGAVRLAAPNSRYAPRRYPPGSHKLARAQRRWERIAARRRRVANAIAGAPEVSEAEAIARGAKAAVAALPASTDHRPAGD
jgi:hypothetical protein